MTAEIYAKTTPPLFLRIIRYAAAILAPLAALFIRQGLEQLIGGELPPYVIFLPVIMLVALFAGLGPGILTTVIAGVLSDLYIISPYEVGRMTAAEALGFTLFCGMGILMSIVAGLYRNTRNRMEELVSERTAALQGANAELYVLNAELSAVNEEHSSVNQELMAREEELTASLEHSQKTEENLLQSQRIYRAIGESIDFGIWICEPDGRNIYASDSFLQLVGITQEECSNFGWGEVLHPDDSEKTIAAWKECTRTGGFWDIEHRFRGRDGQWHPVLARGVPVRDEQGKILCWAGINLDISQLKKTETALRDSEERYRSLFETMSEGFALHELITDELGRPCDYRFIEVNPAFEKLTGLKQSDIINKRILEILPDIEIKWLESYGRVALTGISEHFEEYSPELGRWYQVFAYSPTAGRFVTIFTDITIRKQAEKALQESEERLRLALEAAELAAWDWHIPSSKVVWNRTHFLMLGYQPDEVTPTYDSWASRVHPDDITAVTEIIQQHMEQHKAYSAEFRTLWPDGTIRWLEARGDFSYDQEDRPLRCYGVMIDTTARKEAENLLQRALNRLDLAQQAAQAGIWEWDISSNHVIWSEELFQLFGLDPKHDKASFDIWLSVIHPEDRQRAEDQTRGAVENNTRLMSDYRILLPTGEPRWISAIGETSYDAQGTPLSMAGICIDITERKQIEDILRFLGDCGASPSGEGFFQELARFLAQALNMDFVCIDRLEEDNLTAMTVAVFHNGQFEDNVSYALHDTPCGDLVGKSICCFPQNVQQLFPNDTVLKELEAESYLGATLFSTQGEPIGLIAVISQQPLTDTRLAEATLKMVAARAAGELERQQSEEALQQLNRRLEERVAERTKDLELTIDAIQKEIIERKNAEDALRISEERYALAVLGANDGIWDWDLENDTAYVSPRWKSMLGYGVDELQDIVKEWMGLIHPDDFNTAMVHFEKYIDGEIPEYKLEYRLRHKDGSYRWILTRGTCFRRADGKPYRMAGSHTDISDRKIAEERLLRLNRLYLVLSETGQSIARGAGQQSIFEEICRVAVVHGGFRLAWIGLINTDSGQVEINAAAGETGYLEGIRISARDEPAGRGPTGKVLRSGGHYICNDFQSDPCTGPWHERAQSLGLMASASAAISLNDKVIGALTFYAGEQNYFDQEMERLLLQIASDISFALERLRAIEELREKEQMLMQQGRQAAMGEMIGNIAHQWRQPLNNLGLIIQEMLLVYESGEFTQQYLEKNVDHGMQLIYHMSQTIDGFRNFFRPDKEKSRFTISEVLANTISLLEGTFREHRIAYSFSGKEELVQEGFPNEFSQVLLNILINAKDAMLERQIEKPQIRAEICTMQGRSVLTIADNGGGIEEELLERIFDPYFTTKGPDKGTGIGLFMAKIIIEKNMRGSLTARNSGNGAEFRIEVGNAAGNS